MSNEIGHWWCQSCKEAVIPERVTFQENHDSCGNPVEWVEFALPHPDPYDLLERLKWIVINVILPNAKTITLDVVQELAWTSIVQEVDEALSARKARDAD